MAFVKLLSVAHILLWNTHFFPPNFTLDLCIEELARRSELGFKAFWMRVYLIQKHHEQKGHERQIEFLTFRQDQSGLAEGWATRVRLQHPTELEPLSLGVVSRALTPCPLAQSSECLALPPCLRHNFMARCLGILENFTFHTIKSQVIDKCSF